jgi:hypothetical protein
MTENEELALEVEELNTALELAMRQRDEAIAYAAALTGAVKGASDFGDAMDRIRQVPVPSIAADAFSNAVKIRAAAEALAAGTPQPERKA